jgi:hypothetical protein
MMPTNDERREVAARLRKAWISGCAFATFFEFDCGDFETCQECSEYCTKHLADLIEPEPERTCRLVTHKRQVGGVVIERGDLYCSECDTLLWDSCGDPFYSLSVEEQKFCYNCGAKVVE